MITENLSTLKIHKLTQEQYNRELAAGRIDKTALYLTPDEDLNNYVTIEQLNGKADLVHSHDDLYYTEAEIDNAFEAVQETINAAILDVANKDAAILTEAKDYSDANLEVAQAYADAAKAQAITEGANSAVNTINTKLANDYYDKEQIDNYVLITTTEIDAIWGYATPSTILKDFNYTTNDNDTYTLTEWKGTADGVESTECIIPDDSRIIL